MSLADGPFGYDAVYKPFSRLWRRDMVGTQYEYYNTSKVIECAGHTPCSLALSTQGLETAAWVNTSGCSAYHPRALSLLADACHRLSFQVHMQGAGARETGQLF